MKFKLIKKIKNYIYETQSSGKKEDRNNIDSNSNSSYKDNNKNYNKIRKFQKMAKYYI